MDALEFNKISAGVLGSFLAFMLFGWAGDIIYGTGEDGHHDHHDQAFIIELPDADTAVVEVVEDLPSMAEILLASSAAGGESLWRQCAACHKLEDGANGVGPHLYDVIGRPKGAVAEYAYSDAMASFPGEWTPEAMYAFLESPKGYIPGTKMGYNGMRRSEDRGNMIAYLASISGTDLSPYMVEEEASAADVIAPVMEEAVEEASTMVEDATTAVADAADAVMDDATDAVETAVAAATETADAVMEDATDAMDSATEAVSEAADTATAEAAEAATSVVGALASVQEQVTEQVADATAAVTEVVETATEAVADATAAVPAFMANADAAAGESLFRQCAACHKIEDGARGTGPHLYEVVGRDKGSVEGFRYSNTLAEMDGVWGYEELSGFIANPREYAPGTRMSFRGIRDEQDRANLIAYLESASQ